MIEHTTTNTPASNPASNFKLDPHYQLIAAHYADRSAKRSGVALINHINEGLYVLDRIGAELKTKQAYCLHPLFQGNKALVSLKPEEINSCSPQALVLVMEYRRVANAYFSKRIISDLSEIKLSPLPEVQQMLIADKIQNRKDFEIHHLATHPRSADLVLYFNNWFARLGITNEFYQEMLKDLGAGAAASQ